MVLVFIWFFRYQYCLWLWDSDAILTCLTFLYWFRSLFIGDAILALTNSCSTFGNTNEMEIMLSGLDLCTFLLGKFTQYHFFFLWYTANKINKHYIELKVIVFWKQFWGGHGWPVVHKCLGSPQSGVNEYRGWIHLMCITLYQEVSS